MAGKLSANHQRILDRFIGACKTDERLTAALQVGSTVTGTPDEHSDLDLYLITTDEAHEDFDASRETFIRLLGEPLFSEDFDIPDIVFVIFADGSEVEIHYVSESRAKQVFHEPFEVLLDKKNIMAGVLSKKPGFDEAAQTEKLRRLITWFWHDFSHFVTALARDQLWWAQGQLEVLRSQCVGLARLKNDFSDPEVEDEVYFKIEKALPVEILSPLKETYPPFEKDAMLEAAFLLLQFYKELAVPLAKARGINYPEELEKLAVEHLEKVRDL